MAILRSFGWRPSLPDIRDRQYRRTTSYTALPPRFDLTVPALGAPFEPSIDQGNLGSCGPNTAANNIIYDQLELDGSAVIPSRLFLYYNTRSLMGTVNSDSGVDNRSMLKALARWGWCDERFWPYDISRFKMKPPEQVYNYAANTIKSIQYQAVSQDLPTMKACMVETGKPFIFGFAVYESMLTNDVDASGDIPMPMAGDRQAGGHDVLIVGYDDAAQRFKIKNPWGPSWGRGGYGWIPYQYALNPQLASDFWTVLKVEEPPPAPPVPPTPPIPGPVKTILTVEYSGPGTYRLVP